MKIKSLVPLLAGSLALFLLIAGVAGLFNDKITPGSLTTGEAGTCNIAITAIHQRSPLHEKVAGTVTAKQNTLVSSRILAPIENILVRSGDEVRAGDLLVVLDQRALVARRQQAAGAIESVRAQLDEVNEGYSRIEALFQQGMTSRAELDRVTAHRRTLQAELERSRQVQSEAETAVSYSRIRSPIDGRVIDRFLEAGDTVVPGQKIVALYDPGAMRIEAHVREALAVKLQVGESTQVRIGSLDLTTSAILEELVPSADPGARTFLVKLSLPHGLSIYPGMYAELLVASGEVEELRIPVAAVHSIGQLDFVWLVEDDARVRRFIRPGRRIDGTLAVASGLSGGEEICIE